MGLTNKERQSQQMRRVQELVVDVFTPSVQRQAGSMFIPRESATKTR